MQHWMRVMVRSVSHLYHFKLFFYCFVEEISISIVFKHSKMYFFFMSLEGVHFLCVQLLLKIEYVLQFYYFLLSYYQPSVIENFSHLNFLVAFINLIF